MTAQWSDSATGAGGYRSSAPAPDPSSRQTPLGALLRDRPREWGLREGAGEPGDCFAALRFDATPASVSRTRGFLRATLTQWRLPDLVDDAQTVAAELVANAVTHALAAPGAVPAPRSSAWIALVRTGDSVVCAVADPSPRPPTVGTPQPFAESGRGLHIVAELSETWGHWAAEPAGKTVWARLAGGG